MYRLDTLVGFLVNGLTNSEFCFMNVCLNNSGDASISGAILEPRISFEDWTATGWEESMERFKLLGRVARSLVNNLDTNLES